MEQVIHIKNMVCPRCKAAVEKILNDLSIPFSALALGEVKLSSSFSQEKEKQLQEQLKAAGFELLQSEKSALISTIKSLIVQQIHYEAKELQVNFSTYLSESTKHDYAYLSRLFSKVEGITIERFVAKQKIEKIKELLFYDDLTLSEIAFQLNYSSVAYLSAQFKKETGMTPTEFKKIGKPTHKGIDTI